MVHPEYGVMQTGVYRWGWSSDVRIMNIRRHSPTKQQFAQQSLHIPKWSTQKNPDDSQWIIGIKSFCLLLSSIAKASSHKLLTQTESLDDSTIAIDVAVVQIVEQCAALSYQLCQWTCGSIIFTVLLKMFRQVGNTVWEQCYLALSWTSISVRLSLLSKDLLFFCLI